MTDCEYISMVKSTIVRSERASWLLPIIRAGNRAPGRAGRSIILANRDPDERGR